MNIISRHSCLYSLPGILDGWSQSSGHRTAPAWPGLPPSPGPSSRISTPLPGHLNHPSVKPPTDTSLILDWAQNIQSPDSADVSTRVMLLLHSLTACAILAGFSSGLGAGGIIFWYDGSQPINILSVFSSLVLAPAMLLLPTILLGICSLVMRRFQINSPLPSMLTLSKPLHKALSQFIPKCRGIIERASTLTAFHLALFDKVEALYLSLTLQLFTLCFLLGASGYGTWKMVSTDLAFCWSATPALITPSLVQDATSALALPWSFFFPTAIPTLQLIEKTRYYRLHAPLRSSLEYDPEIMGQWWAFMILTIITWALLPRLIMLLITFGRYKNVVSYTLLHLPHVPALLTELKPGARITTSAPETSSHLHSQEMQNLTDNLDTIQIQIPPLTADSKIVLWSMSDLDLDLVSRLPQLSSFTPMHAGGTTSISGDLEATTAISNTPRLDLVLVFVKSWEPPLMEFLDFMGDLRKAARKKTPIYVVPLALDETGTGNVIWSKVLRKLADPWIHVTPPSTLTIHERASRGLGNNPD